jgi:hypothetical protein
VAKALTPAQQYLLERQRRYPPRYLKISGLDRVKNLYEILRPELPVELTTMVSSGTIAIGEVGHNVPDVRLIPINSGNFVIEFTSGMMDFQYGVARALAGLDQSNAGLNAQPQTVVSVASVVEHLLRQWARYTRWHWLWPWRRIKVADFLIAREVQNWIEMIVTMQELFLLAHELGHVALDIGLVKLTSDNNEVDADRCGLEFLIPAVEKHWHKRIVYAGPIISIRILAALEGLGVEFSEQYPLQTKRLELLREQIFNICPTKHYYYEVSTIMVSYQDMFDDIERHINPTSQPALPDAERVLIRLVAELEEVARGNVSLQTFIENIGYISKVIPHKTINQATQILVTDYMRFPPYPGGFLSEDLKLVMAAKLNELISALPANLKPLFPESMPRTL